MGQALHCRISVHARPISARGVGSGDSWSGGWPMTGRKGQVAWGRGQKTGLGKGGRDHESPDLTPAPHKVGHSHSQINR